MIYIIIFVVIVLNSVVLGFLFAEGFKKRLREKLGKELQEILYHAKRLYEELKNSIKDIPQFSEHLADELTPFIKTCVSETIDKYVEAEKDKLRDLLVPQVIDPADVEFISEEDADRAFNSFQELEDAVAAGQIEEKVPTVSSEQVADYSDKYLKRPDVSLNNVGVKRIAIPPELWHTINSLSYANASGSQNIEPLSISAVAFNIINEHFQTHADEIAVLADRGSEKMLRGYDRY